MSNEPGKPVRRLDANAFSSTNTSKSVKTPLYLCAIFTTVLATVLILSANAAGEAEAEPPQRLDAAAIYDLPPVSERSVQALLDFLLVHLTYNYGYVGTQDLAALTFSAEGLEHVLVFRKQEAGGALVMATRPAAEGTTLIIRATTPDEILLNDLADLRKTIAARLDELKHRAVRDLLKSSKVVDYHLSYIRADRALGALKAMGYNVLEMNETGGVGGSHVYTLSDVTDYRLPLITTVVDSANTSLIEEKSTSNKMGSMTPSLGGRSLTEVTDSSSQQRLLIAYDPNNPETLSTLRRDIETVVDVAAQQILIEGMIVEVSDDKLRDLGVEYSLTHRRTNYSFERIEDSTRQPFTFQYSDAVPLPKGFEATLRMLIENGSAEILSKPSILALNNYQARIRIGREIPISTTVATAASTNVDISYFFMGIVLNIKPRISNDQKEVSMQVEAIVSSKAPVDGLMAGEHEVAPVIDSRVVQTFARVSNNTPFIIGGLISHDLRERTAGIPLLMDIPLIGALFRSTSKQIIKNEVIVVITPRVVPRGMDNYSAVIPKDSEEFEFLGGSKLFRNTYRIREEDKFDLTFVYENPRFGQLAAQAKQRVEAEPALANDAAIEPILNGNIPGETNLMIRMLYEVVRSVERKILARKPESQRDDRILDERIIMLKPVRDDAQGIEEVKVMRLTTELAKLQEKPGSALIIHFDLKARHRNNRLMPPLNTYIVETKDRNDYDEWMNLLNRRNEDGEFESAAIVIQTPRDLQRLKTCLILKKLLEINNLPKILHVADFPVGVQILYPNLENESGYGDGRYVADSRTAELFYTSDFYYQAFQKTFHSMLDKLEQALKTKNNHD